MNISEIVLLVIIGLTAGVIGGFLGLGGGIIVIPALVFFMGFSQHMAQGTNLAFMLAPIGIFAVINYYRGGYVNVKYAVILGLTFAVGAYVGSKFSLSVPDHILKKAFGAMMILLGLKMFLGT